MEDLINFAAVSLAGDAHWDKAEKDALANRKDPDEVKIKSNFKDRNMS